MRRATTTRSGSQCSTPIAEVTHEQLGVINGWTLSNIKNGSGALWVHFFAAYALSFTAFKLLIGLFSDVRVWMAENTMSS